MKKIYLFQTLLIILYSASSNGQDKLSKGNHFADINDITIHYYVSGKGPVCLMPSPGWGPSINYLKNSLLPFEKYFTMVYYDTRISGQSTGPEDPSKYTSKDFMDDMEAMRVYLEQSKVWIMGHSDGGFQVLNYGIHFNDKLNGIIALQARAGSDSLYKAEFKKMVMKREGQPWFEKGSNVLFGKDTTKYSIAEFIEITFPFFFHDTNKMEDFLKLGDPQLSNKASEYTGASKFGREYLFPELSKITVPTLVVTGDDDFICDKISQGDRIHNSIPGSDEIVIKDAGHFSWIEQPTQFFEDVTNWLKKQKLNPHE
jgi:proline iminopeptidase